MYHCICTCLSIESFTCTHRHQNSNTIRTKACNFNTYFIVVVWFLKIGYVTVNSDDGLMHRFLIHFFYLSVKFEDRLICNAGPYVYQQWFSKGFKEPWEEVKRCIPSTKYKSTKETSYIKTNIKTNGKGCLPKRIIINQLKCTKLSYCN